MSVASNPLFSTAKVKEVSTGILACSVFLLGSAALGIGQGFLEDKIREWRKKPGATEKLESPPAPNLNSWKQ